MVLRIPRWGWIGLVAASLAACDRDAGPPPSPPPPATDGGRARVVFLGTSLTAGLGVDPSQAYPAVLQGKIDSAGLRFVAVNAGVSGETSAGARRRIDWLLREPAAVLVIETGANDGLRGLDVDSLAANIQAIVDRARQQSPAPRIILVGMEALPNFGLAYGRKFSAVYPALAKRNGLPLVPFLLEGVAGLDSLNQADMLHPTAAGQRRVAETVWPVLEKVLRGSA
ncbi:MAG TPA: arylesterase [Gemmatimonadales bacterium]|nr:arylesterase [Gemmatimonadales bacterium]